MAEEVTRGSATARRRDNGVWAVTLGGSTAVVGSVVERDGVFAWSMEDIDESGSELSLEDAIDAIGDAD